MKTIYLTGRDPYIIGQTGESNAVTLRVDVDEWKDAYDGGHGILTFRWPNKTVYPLDTNLVQYNDKYYLEAIVTSNETRYPGWVVVQAQWYDGETLVYSRAFSCKVLQSHDGYVPGGDTVPTWVTALIARLDAMDDTEAAVETYKEGAELAAQNAADSLSAAQAAAESASASAATATQAAETATQKADSIPPEYTSMVSHIAEVFDAAKAYSAGEYVWNNVDSKLYLFTKDHAAGEWTGTDAKEAVLADDVGGLRSATLLTPDIYVTKNAYIQNGARTTNNRDLKITDGFIELKVKGTNNSGFIVNKKVDESYDFKAVTATPIDNFTPVMDYLSDISIIKKCNALKYYVEQTTTASMPVAFMQLLFYNVSGDVITKLDRIPFAPETNGYNIKFFTIPDEATHYVLLVFQTPSNETTTRAAIQFMVDNSKGQIDSLIANDTALQAEIDTLSAQLDTAGKLESTGDSTDRTAEIQAKLTANGYCELGDGEFVVANLEMPAGTELRGQGYATVLKLDTSLTSGAAVIVNTNCTLKDMSIVGADAKITFTSESIAGNRHGIRRSYRRAYNVNISNVRVRYFDGYGIYDVNGGTPVQGKDDTQHGGMNADNCFFDGCFACMYIQSASNAFSNCECANGFYGAYTYAHGNVFTNCVFLGNLTDAYVKSSGATFVGCLFRKETSTVEGDALVVIDGARPLKAVGCTFNNCGGIRVATTDSRITACMDLFDGCEFYNMVLPIVCTSGRGILFNGCMFYEDVTASGNIEETTAGAVKLKNCYRTTTGALLER